MKMFGIVWVIIQVIILSNAHQKIHQCIHDKIEHNPVKANNIPYKNHPYDKSLDEDKSRRLSLSGESYDYIRVTPYWDTLETQLSGDNLEYVKSLVSASIRYFESFAKVVPIDGTFYLPRKCSLWYTVNGYTNCVEYSSTCSQVTIPDDHYEQDYLWDDNDRTAGPTTLAQGSGVQDSDYIVYVSYGDTDCSGSTLAYATPCVQDQYGRPIAGGINFCSAALSDEYWKEDVMTTLHELTHAMIMSPSLWDDFIDSDGNTMTLEQVVETKTLSTGYDQSYIISDKVKSLAQSHYNCYDTSDMPGLPIEDDGSSGSAGSHWEEHQVNTEYMGSTIYSAMTFASEFTFALMEDSGWYQVDYNYAEPFYWGHDEGCDFFTEDCVDKTTHTSNWPQYYCDTSSDYGCTYDSAGAGYCLMYSYNSIPSVFQYYSDSQQGGTENSEFCSFRSPSSQYDSTFEEVCWDTRGSSLVPSPYSSISWGLTSRCVSTETTSGYQRGYCFTHECYNYDSTTNQWDGVYITISSSETITCTQSDKETTKTSSSTSLTITCPDIDSLCRNENPFACYWGNWNNDLNECICSPGYIGDTCDTQDTSLVDDLQLSTSSDITTPAPTIAESYLCWENGPINLWNTDSWSYDGLYNTLPSYKLISGGYTFYIYWAWWYHQWYLGTTKGSTSYYSYCQVQSEYTSDINDCSGNWVYSGSVYTNLNTQFGQCTDGSTPSPVTNGQSLELITTSPPDSEESSSNNSNSMDTFVIVIIIILILIGIMLGGYFVYKNKMSQKQISNPELSYNLMNDDAVKNQAQTVHGP